MTTVVGVHGVGNHHPNQDPHAVAAALSRAWRASLGRGPGGAVPARHAVRVAYYAHHLRDQAGGRGNDRLDKLSPEAEELARAWLVEAGADGEVAQGRGTASLRQEVGRAARRSGIARFYLESFVAICFSEVSHYLADPRSPGRLSSREAVARVLRAAEPPVVVLAHSLGSVVAYETLWTNPEVPVDLLVTLGSPLALPWVVFPRLDPAPVDGRGARPPGVRRWVNLADVGDLIALPPKGVGDSFDGVAVDAETSIHLLDFHRADHYLASAALADTLAPYLGD